MALGEDGNGRKTGYIVILSTIVTLLLALGGLGITITVSSLHDVSARYDAIDVRLSNVWKELSDVQAINSGRVQRLQDRQEQLFDGRADVEKRLRDLEQWRYEHGRVESPSR